MDAKKSKGILAAYKKQGARIETKPRVRLKGTKDFSLWYTPGVGTAALYLATHPEEARLMSVKKNSVAVVSDGSAVLGLGNIGPYGALPVMEGKALIFRAMAGIDAWPVVLAGLMNAAKVVRKDVKTLRIVIIGAGAAGVATAKLFLKYGVKDVIATDSKGIVSKERTDLNTHKRFVAERGNPRNVFGPYQEALRDADVVIGLSGGGKLSKGDVRAMGKAPIVFALANPIPEIMPEDAMAAGAVIIATGRSDFPNQLNNALVFPGIFRGALDRNVKRIADETKLRVARALASLVAKPTAGRIIPDLLDKRVVKTVARAVR